MKNLFLILMSLIVAGNAFAAKTVQTKVGANGVSLSILAKNSEALAPALQKQIAPNHKVLLNFNFPLKTCSLGAVKNDTQSFACQSRPEIAPATLVIQDLQTKQQSAALRVQDFSLIPNVSSDFRVSANQVAGVVKDVDGDGDSTGDDDCDGK